MNLDLILKQERERQGDLVRDLVLSRIQRSPEKRERRGSYGSLTPPISSSRALRAESEPRMCKPDYQEMSFAPALSLRPVSEDTNILPSSTTDASEGTSIC